MSFSSEQKSLLIKQNIKSQCCKRAMIEGFLASRAVVVGDEIHMSLGSDEVAEFAVDLIYEIYSKKATITHYKDGGRRKILVFDSASARKYIDLINNSSIQVTEKCSDCLSSFMRGVFLAAGRVSDPEKIYLLEFSFANEADKFIEFLKNVSLNPRISEKIKETVVYFRDSNELEDFFALSGMNQTAFALMNAKIKRELINNAQRIANCETNNIGKAISASMHQISVIEDLIKTGKLSHLPDELQMTALARLEHRDLSLSQLASVMVPPISKPGLSHRLKKIMEIAKELLDK